MRTLDESGIRTANSAARRMPANSGNNTARGIGVLLFTLTYVLFDEIVFSAGLDYGFSIWKVLLDLSWGLLLYFVASIPRNKKVAFYVHAFLMMLVNTIYIAQFVYIQIFGTPFMTNSLSGAGNALAEFFGVAWNTWVNNWPVAAFFCLQIVMVFTLYRMLFYSWQRPEKMLVKSLIATILMFVISFMLPVLFASNINGAGYYMRYEHVAVPSAKQLGMQTSMLMDVKMNVFGIKEEYDFSQDEVPAETEETLPAEEETAAETETAAEPVQEEEPVTYGQNIQDITFNMEESDEELLAMNKYFASREPTNQNEYTGYFEGKDLILLTCEGFSKYFVSEEHTPTLYKLLNEGFVFDNFYTPIWNVSTSDGEFVTTTGLVPEDGVWSYTEIADNYMPYAFGWQFQDKGYETLAFHNHTWTYYNRDKSYPNMGYTYYGRDHGLDVEKVWPESDLQMMELSIPMWIDLEGNVHVYYLTVSGHLEYSYPDNMMAWRNKETIDSWNLEFSDHVQAYYACNYELEKALTYLIDELDKAGRLDNTVIAFGADHYPYGLTNDENAELQGVDPSDFDTEFQMYENGFCIWNNQMTEPVHVDKYCCNMDMCATLHNMFNLPYDSRLMIGRDVFADNYKGMVLFMDRSFITDTYKYDASSGTVIPHEEGVTISDEQLQSDISAVAQMFKYSAGIIERDYYKYLFPEGFEGTAAVPE